MKKIFLVLVFTLLFSACSKENDKEIIVATNSWIGYAPLFYAYEKGYLDPLNIKIINNASLAEAANIYHIGKADMVTTTQHEYNSLKNSMKDIYPAILINRSNGGDMILSNFSIDKLHKSQKINVYLEVDSINQEMIKDFIQNNNFSMEKFIFINQDQQQIQDVKYSTDTAKIIVTYTPYNLTLLEKGFHEIASTKQLDSIIVIDALCTTKNMLINQKERLKKLKKIIDKSINEIQEDTRDSHKLIAKYLSDVEYVEYVKSLKHVKWLNDPSPELLEFIAKYDYTKETLITE